MAKVAFNKLGLKIDTSINNLQWEDVSIEVKKYLPIEEKIELVANVVNNSSDDNGYYNPIKVKIFLALEIMYHYTNINFTDKMKETPLKLYDQLTSSKLYNAVIELIDENEFMDIVESVQETIESVYSYKNSVMGILDTVSSDYSNLNFDAAKIQKMLGDPENLGLLREVLDKLG